MSDVKCVLNNKNFRAMRGIRHAFAAVCDWSQLQSRYKQTFSTLSVQNSFSTATPLVVRNQVPEEIYIQKAPVNRIDATLTDTQVQICRFEWCWSLNDPAKTSAHQRPVWRWEQVCGPAAGACNEHRCGERERARGGEEGGREKQLCCLIESRPARHRDHDKAQIMIRALTSIMR